MNREELLKKLELNKVFINITQKIIYKCLVPYYVKKKIIQGLAKRIRKNKRYFNEYLFELEKQVYSLKKPNKDFNIQLKTQIETEINKIDLFLFENERFVSFI
jgi:hypothetical protein